MPKADHIRHSWPQEPEAIRSYRWHKCLVCDCWRVKIRGAPHQYYRMPTQFSEPTMRAVPSCIAMTPLEQDIRRYIQAQKAELGI